MKQWSGQEQIVPEEEQVKTVKWYENPDGVTKACALVLLVAGLASLYLFCGDFWDKTFRLAVSGNVKALAEYLRSFGSYAVLVSFVIDVLINMGSVFPSVFVSTANGLIFGLPLGVTISWLAETVGVVFSFLLMRFFFRNTAERVIRKANKLQDIDRASEKNGIVWMTFARALPYFPSGILTAIGAVSRMSVRDYIIANLIGKFPSTALEVIIGHDIVNFHQYTVRLTLLVLLAAVIFYLGKRHLLDKGKMS
ncbi:MAG: TVP38/TMEM64 family protein [Succiniclasticum sp.]|nr:TVP38/TMEM64 family protein [Succiniclasticum sp.]MCI6223130.1 TVP38/TMEM64 family protein [Selenomonadales bacterium]MDY2870285.1 TVP38/TMEM64 family protein [Succiniclasticum sp.]MDY6346361.1 TVP38/TMEM64 family protein [Succiniclasticum sp.]